MEPDRPYRIHPAIWLIAGGLIAALVAIFVFKVAVGTVITYSFIGLMLISHLFMHGGHSQRAGTPANRDGTADGPQSRDEHNGHSGGCH